ncbi:hypothetical protein ACLKA6_002213 [Drosophila palustris]
MASRQLERKPGDCASEASLCKSYQSIYGGIPTWLRDPRKYAAMLGTHTLFFFFRIQGQRDEGHSIDHPGRRYSNTLRSLTTHLILTKLIRIYIRFALCTNQPQRANTSQTALTFDEIQAARIICLKHAQTCFKDISTNTCKQTTQNHLTHKLHQGFKDGLLRSADDWALTIATRFKHPILFQITPHNQIDPRT